MSRQFESDRRPPVTRTVAAVDDHHGTRVADPYRWLEAGTDTSEVRAFIEAQTAHSEHFLAAIPEREHLRSRLGELWNTPRWGAPLQRGERRFQFRNSGLQDQDVLYVLERDESARRVLDPNTMSADGTVALVAIGASPDGRMLAYGVSEAGSDWRSWHIRDVDSGEDLVDVVQWSRYASVCWLPDGSGFYYVGYPEPSSGDALIEVARAPEIRLHRLGTTQSEDTTIYGRPDDPQLLLGLSSSHDGSQLLISTRHGSSGGNGMMLATDGQITTLVELGQDTFVFLGARDGELLFWTDRDTPMGSIVAATSNASGITWRTMVAEGGERIDHALLVNDEVVVALLRDASHTLVRIDLETGSRSEVSLPEFGALQHPLEPNPLLAERFTDAVTFSFSTILTPPIPYRLHLADGTLEPLAEPTPGLDPANYVTRQLFTSSPDGTRIPMFVTHKRDLVLDGSHPTLLYGYGGFDVSQTPNHKTERLAWLELGGVFALANLRGGGEYGAAWHHAGRRGAKQNVFDDFIACAEMLIASGFTSRERLALQGRSNGGLLVGACLTQRPDLFAAALPAVGVLDMLRYEQFTVGWAWATEYGSVDDPEEFATLFAYSPLHNLKPGTDYPATLIATGDHDDRVVPAHSFKFAAALQAAQGGNAPILLRVDTRAGHGFGKPTAMLIDEAADHYAFLIRVLGVER